MVHEGNKDEAEKCFKLAREYFKNSESEKALRFAHKADRLFPTERYKGEIIEYRRHKNGY